MKSNALKFLLPLLLCLIIFPTHTIIKIGYKVPVLDAEGYAGQSLHFRVIPTAKQIEQAKNNNIIFAPLYPAFLKSMGSIIPTVQEALECYAYKKGTCNVNDLKPIYFIQMALLSISIYFIFLTLYFLTESYAISLSSMALVLFAGKLQTYGTWLITDAIAYSFFFSFILMYVYNLKRDGKTWHYFLMGIALSGAALTRPTYLYLIYASILLLPLFMIFVQKKPLVATLKKMAPFIFAIIICIGPWIFRNYYYFGVPGVSAGYGSFILSERVAYNLMNWTEWAVSFIYWLPDFGDTLAAAIFSEENYRRLNFETKDGFYLYGNSFVRDAVFSQAATDQGRMSILLNDYILGDLFKHVMVTFSMAARGMWTAKYFGLIGFICLIPAFFILKKKVGTANLLAFVFPFYFILGLNAFVSVSIPRYNMPLVMVYALAFTTALFYFWPKVKQLFTRS